MLQSGLKLLNGMQVSQEAEIMTHTFLNLKMLLKCWRTTEQDGHGGKQVSLKNTLYKFGGFDLIKIKMNDYKKLLW